MDLTQLIRQQIREKGPIPFRDFMDKALYHPELGYYMAERDKIGADGDFYTSCCLGPVFGAMIAKQIAEMWQICGETEFTIVEFGAGDGRLCHDILDYFRQHTDRYDHLNYVIIEKSPFMRRKAKTHLGGRICWYDSIAEVGAFCGCVLSNELVDNFPVHLVQMEEELMEVFVDDGDGLVEILKPATPPLKAYFEDLNIQLPKGYRTEVNLESGRWLEQISLYLQKGYVLTIDYGYQSEEFYKPSRSRGTLLCYSRHDINEAFYRDIGQQDITAHVNFSALAHQGRQVGFSCCGLTTQAEFLLALDFKGYLRQQPTEGTNILQQVMKEARLTHTLLIDMGSKFKVLIQSKGMPEFTPTGLKQPGAFH